MNTRMATGATRSPKYSFLMASFQRFILSPVIQIMVSYIFSLIVRQLRIPQWMCSYGYEALIRQEMELSRASTNGGVVPRVHDGAPWSCTTEWKTPYYSMFSLSFPLRHKGDMMTQNYLCWFIQTRHHNAPSVASRQIKYVPVHPGSSNRTWNNWRRVTTGYYYPYGETTKQGLYTMTTTSPPNELGAERQPATN